MLTSARANDTLLRAMQTAIKRLPLGLVEIAITVPPDELRPFLEAAAQALATISKIEGFRPGKTPYALVAARLGEARIYEAASDAAVRATYVRAATELSLRVIGEPVIDIKTLVPGSPLAFTATAPVMPAVTKVADYRAFKVAKKEVAVSDTEVDRALRDLQKMQTRETPVERVSTKADKIVVNVSMSRDRVPVEGGVARGHQVYLAEPYYIPGFTEAVTGLKKGDKKNFSLTFPKDHYQKTLAGKVIDFDVSVDSVFELSPPALDDAFAATLGQKIIIEVLALIQKNLAAEMQVKET